jgi:hypothetical protein
MRGAIPPLPQYVFMAWCLVNHRDDFTFIFIYDVYKGNYVMIGVSLAYDSALGVYSLHCQFSFRFKTFTMRHGLSIH